MLSSGGLFVTIGTTADGSSTLQSSVTNNAGSIASSISADSTLSGVISQMKPEKCYNVITTIFPAGLGVMQERIDNEYKE